MKIDLLLATIANTLQKKKVDQLALIVTEYDFAIIDLIDLTFHKDQKIGFRAAWILEQVYTQRQPYFLSGMSYFLQKFPSQDNLSAQRHFAKILALITSNKASAPIKKIINNYDTDLLVDTVFGWLIDEDIPVAIKSHCLNVLANLSIKHPWIKEELLKTINFLIDRESIGFHAKAKQVKKQLAKI